MSSRPPFVDNPDLRVTWRSFLVQNPEKTRSRDDMLYASHPELNDGVYVAMEHEGGRRYAFFKNHIKLYRHMQAIPPRQRAFHEVIPTGRQQKLRFDIDVALDAVGTPESVAILGSDALYPHLPALERLGQVVLDRLIAGIRETLQSLGVDELDLSRHVMLFSSHGPTKRSYHLILVEWSVTSSRHAKAFYDLCMEKSMTWGLSRFVDSGIYSPNHCLRLFHSYKFGTERLKTACLTPTFEGVRYRFELDRDWWEGKSALAKGQLFLHYSLITDTTYCMRHLDIPIPEDDPRPTITLDSEVLIEADRLFQAHPMSSSVEIRETKSSSISYSRIASGECDICNRTHDNDGLSILIVPSGEARIYCSRACNGKGSPFISLGKIAAATPKRGSRSRATPQGHTIATLQARRSNSEMDDLMSQIAALES